LTADGTADANKEKRCAFEVSESEIAEIRDLLLQFGVISTAEIARFVGGVSDNPGPTEYSTTDEKETRGNKEYPKNEESTPIATFRVMNVTRTSVVAPEVMGIRIFGSTATAHVQMTSEELRTIANALSPHAARQNSERP
jgi:hypothetical protein